MVIDHRLSEYQELRTKLHDIVSVAKISSVEMICEQTGIDEDSARTLLQDLVNAQVVSGRFSEDGKRFFLSDVKISDAPVISREERNLEIKKTNTKTAKLIGLGGFFTLILGWILRGLTGIHQGMENAGVALFMIGFVVMTVGWIQCSRFNPPEKLR
jgi:hypothetical protein